MPQSFFQSLSRESDRAAAVLGTAFLDTLLQKAFARRLSPRISSDALEYRGVLGSFSARVDMAYLLGWIDLDTNSDLDLVRSFRNDFAHKFDHELSFATPKENSLLLELRSLKGIDAEVERAGRDLPVSPEAAEGVAATLANLKAPRARFELPISLLAAILAQVLQDPVVPAAALQSATLAAQKAIRDVPDV